MASTKIILPKAYNLARTTIAGAGNVNTTLYTVPATGKWVRCMNIWLRANVNALAANTGFVRVFHFIAAQATSFIIFERNISGLPTTCWEYYSNRLMEESDSIIIQDVNNGAVNASYNVTIHNEEYQ